MPPHPLSLSLSPFFSVSFRHSHMSLTRQLDTIAFIHIISVGAQQKCLASKWEVRLTIYDCNMEYGSVNRTAYTLHTMRGHIYVNGARR